MKRLRDAQASTFGRETTLRMTRAVSEALSKHMQRDPHQEQMAFATARQATTADGTLFILDEVILPDPQDLAEQSAAGVSPTPAYQRFVYHCAFRSRTSIVDFHTHPGTGVPMLSDIDELHALRNAQYITAKFPEPASLLMLVWNSHFDAFDGVVYDRRRRQFRQLDRVEILGRPSRTWTVGRPQTEPSQPTGEAFDRQHRIPGWNQAALEEQRIGIIGAGGNGAPLLQTLLGIGAGRRGFIAISDHDLVERSNLPRLPYAYEDHVGIPKVAAATQYAGRKSPSTPIFPFACRLNERALQERLKMATVLFCCVDNDGARKEANELAVRHGIPLIDLGCDIQVSDEKVVAGGQIRVILPGENACLVCCRGFDPAEAAFDQMSAAGRAQRTAAGYVRGADAEATPSVANLNGLTAQFAIAQFLALVHGEQFAPWDYLHFDQFSGRTVTARTTAREQCPLCGHAERSKNAASAAPAEPAPATVPANAGTTDPSSATAESQ